jgi:acyl transferase domain-containing protein/acyl carrier protein
MSESDPRDTIDPIAIVGMSGRFSGARDIDTFWNNLKSGVESIEFFSDEELAASGVDARLIANPAYVKAGGVVPDADLFDARYFGFSPREAQAMDPQQRVFLECAVEALEHAGLDPDSFPGPIAVYAGVGVSTYLKLLEARPDFVALVGGLQVLIGTNKDHLTTHLSYKLNLRGPSIVVQTACSTSLVAVTQACQALLTYQCDAALAGGVSITAFQREGYLHEEGGIDSPDGHCRAFDVRAKGTVGGNGAGVVVLKRLADARAAGDVVHALIRGFAVNNDGAQKVGYTAPSIQGQAEVIALAQAMAGVKADTISYVETHGTGTPLGDPIEVAALTQAFRATTQRKRYCALGAVKTNIGHLDCAAGIAGLIKTVLALEHRQIPANLHFESPNPKIDFAASPFYVSAALMDWTAPFPRRAGVSSFGIGGTNAHVIVEEAPPPEPSGPSRAVQLITVSARTAQAFECAKARLAGRLEGTSGLDLADVAFTLHSGRRAHEHRAAFTCRSVAEAISALKAAGGVGIHQNTALRRNPPVVFVFPGQGSQYIGMALGLYNSEPTFREMLDRCSALLREPLGMDIRDLLVCHRGATGVSFDLDETWLAQPALFSVEYALARTWLDWGIRPAGMLGHSIGEYTAACLAGVFSLEDTLTLVAARGRLVQTLPPGAMLAVPLPASEVSALVRDVEVAAVNAPALTTVAGEVDAIERLARRLKERGIESKRLRTSHAFHSRMLDPILAAFRAEVERVPRRAPEMRYVSNVTGTWIRPAEAGDPEYYVRQLRESVRFVDGVRTLLSEGASVLLEVGPGHSLTSLVRQQLQPGSGVVAVPSLGAGNSSDDAEALLDALALLWSRGASVDWKAFHAHERRRKIVLPGYPFEHERYWIDPNPNISTQAYDEEQPGAGEYEDTGTRFYLPSWSRGQTLAGAQSVIADDEPDTCWLIFRDAAGLGDRLGARLRDLARHVAMVDSGPVFEERPQRHYQVRPDEPEDYSRLLESLKEAALVPRRVLHLWSVDRWAAANDGFDALQQRGCYSLLAFVQCLVRQGRMPTTSIVVVTSEAQRIMDTDTLRPEKTTVMGPCRSIPQEYLAIVCRVVDVEVPGDARWRETVIDRLLSEISASDGEVTVAYRGTYRWIQTYEPVQLDAKGFACPLRQHGLYLITGGLGRLGLLIARWLATRTRGRLILTSRSRLPEKQDWPRLLSEDPESQTSRIIKQLQTIERCGSELDVLSVDVADEATMRTALSDIRRRHGPLHGVFHCAGATHADHFPAVASVTRSICEEHFRSKVHGLVALDRLLDGATPDFVIAMSSLAAVLGGLGFLPYAAANIFMDAFAETKRRDERARWISINWDGWSVDNDAGKGLSGAEDEANGSLTVKEGLAALECILASPPGSQVLVVAGDLEPRLREWVALTDVRAALPELDAGDREPHTRPRLAVKYRRPTSDLERQIAHVWQQLLGVEQVGVDDNFFELGGHSLLAIQLAARLRERYRVDLPVESVFSAPTVASLAAEVERRNSLGSVDDATIETLLARVEQMDDGQVRALLAEDDDGAPGGREGRR